MPFIVLFIVCTYYVQLKYMIPTTMDHVVIVSFHFIADKNM